MDWMGVVGAVQKMISTKQKKILAFPYSDYDALICDGAVRSGKTSIMMWAYVRWAMENFSGQRFGICGATVDSATKNIVMPFISMTLAKERYALRWRRADKTLEVTRGNAKNCFEVFGGKDEASFRLIQGRTLAGVLLDEVVLMPQSFVNQALTRCSVDGSKLWFSCNPGSPNHWFYTDWIKRHKELNALYLHFVMNDNPSLSEKIKAQYNARYTGVFYERYVLGKWTLAEGLVYPMFDNIAPTIERPYEKYVLSMDYGTQNPTAILLWGLYKNVWYVIREYYHSGRETNQQKTTSQYHSELEKLVGGLPVYKVIIDPSATPFIAELYQKKRFKPWKANNDVLDGIQHTAQVLQEKKIMFNDCCKRTIAEFRLYCWDEKASEKSGEDKVVKENDHAMDAIRYFVNTAGIWRKKREYKSILS